MPKQLELFKNYPKIFKIPMKQARGTVQIFADFYPRATENVNIRYGINDEMLAFWIATGQKRYQNYVDYVRKYAKAQGIH